MKHFWGLLLRQFNTPLFVIATETGTAEYTGGRIKPGITAIRYCIAGLPFCCIVAGGIFLAGAAAMASDDGGPLQTTNRFPLHMMVLTPQAVRAELPEQNQWEITLAAEYSSTYFNFRNPSWDLVIDMEMLVADLSLVYGSTDNVAFRLNLPLISMQDGFLDGFLQNYHDFLGVSNYNREDRPKDDFEYRVTKDGEIWLRGEAGGLQMGEAKISTQFSLPSMTLAGRDLAGSLLLTLKIPTGDADKGLGSGRFDVGVFLPVHWKGTRWSTYMMPGSIWVGDPETIDAGVSARNSLSLLAGAAFAYSDKWCWLAQLNYYSSPFEKTGLDELDKGTLELVFGVRRKVSRKLFWEFAFGEDLTYSVPDFNLRLGATWRFSGH
jgi:hypothetical protein